MERLLRGVGAVGNVFARRMPERIDAEAEGLVGLGIVGRETTFVKQQGCSMRSSDVKTHTCRVATIETMAVDPPFELRIFDEWRLLEVREVTLIDAHLAPHLIARLDETIAQTVVDAVGADIEIKRLIGMPPVVKLH